MPPSLSASASVSDPFPLVPSIRDASRQLVRELGFMRTTLAGTDFSPSAVHALIEIGERNVRTATDLRLTLNLEKSTISRLLRKLVEAGQVLETPNDLDAREKTLSLTLQGTETLAEINHFAQTQVMNALATTPPDSGRTILEGLQVYAAALRADRTGSSLRLQSVERSLTPTAKIVRGYRPGVLARAVEMHMRYYARLVGFGKDFESQLAAGLADFISRLENPRNEIWAAVVDGGQIIGTLCVDGEDFGEDKAHLRAFIVDENFWGAGIGGRLLTEAMRFVDSQAFDETHLWTFRGLDAARRLYERSGFVQVEEAPSTRWGEEVMAQLFIRKSPVDTA